MSGALREPTSSPSVEEVVDHLASSDALVVPASVARAGTPVRSYLWDLLTRKPAIFLERHSALLEDAHLRVFDHLRGDYEVDFHLARLVESRSPTPAQAAAARRVTRMRRLAHLDVLESQGHFTEHAMRLREPVLFHQHVGAALETREAGDQGGSEAAGSDETERAHAVSLALLAPSRIDLTSETFSDCFSRKDFARSSTTAGWQGSLAPLVEEPKASSLRTSSLALCAAP